MNKKYLVRLSDAERRVCADVVKELKGSSQKARRARILRQADADGPAWTDEKISAAFGCRAAYRFLFRDFYLHLLYAYERPARAAII